MMCPRFDYKKESAISPLFLSLIRVRQIHRHIYREKHRENDNIERNKVLGYGSNCKSVDKLNIVKKNL